MTEVAKQKEVSEATLHRGRIGCGGMTAEDAKELSRPREENRRLERMVAGRELQIEMLKEISRGSF